jgi:hypothetical protein
MLLWFIIRNRVNRGMLICNSLPFHHQFLPEECGTGQLLKQGMVGKNYDS